jgi:hypothetical protein
MIIAIKHQPKQNPEGVTFISPLRGSITFGLHRSYNHIIPSGLKMHKHYPHSQKLLFKEYHWQ